MFDDQVPSLRLLKPNNTLCLNLSEVSHWFLVMVTMCYIVHVKPLESLFINDTALEIVTPCSQQLLVFTFLSDPDPNVLSFFFYSEAGKRALDTR